MTKLIFVRHAQSDSSVKDDLTRPLTESGIAAAKKIPELFIDTHIDHFYCSPYIRSMNTIQYLADQCSKHIITCSDLRERKIGTWVDDFDEYAQKQWHDFDYKVENGESLNEVQRRNINQVNKILECNQNKNIVIGTHGTALCTILNHYDADYNFEYFQSIVKKMPLFIELEFDGLSLISIRECHKQIVW
ncbi:histidine phosphatase family protein [Vibrio sp. WJH972]